MFGVAPSGASSDSTSGQFYAPVPRDDNDTLEAEECTQAEFSEPVLNDVETPELDGLPQPWGRLICMQGGAAPIDLQPREEGSGRALNQVTLGRGKACEVMVNDRRVSNTHCRIFCMQSTSSFGSGALEVYIEDMSSNGTWINGDTRLRNNEKRLLNSGDEVSLSNPSRAAGGLAKGVSFTFVRLNRSRHAPGGLNAGTAAASGAGSSSLNKTAAAAVACDIAGRPVDDAGAARGSSSQQQKQPLLRSATLTAGNITDDYDVRHVIGNGQCGEVRMAIQRRSGKPVAVKEIKTKRFKMTPGLSAAELVQEADMLRAVKHPYIVQLEDIYMTDSALYLVMELVEGGDLFDRIIEKGTYEEPLARDLMGRVLTAVAYLHSKDIVHRDLKPENILLVRRDDDVDVKITDFGLAKRANKDGLKTFCGTPQYFAPEVLKRRNTVQGAGRYGKEADMWSLGVILYILLSGTHPFNDETLFEQIQGAWYSVDEPEWEEVSAEAKDLIAHLLVADPEDRLSADDALQHPFITGRPLSTVATAKTRSTAALAAAAGVGSDGVCDAAAAAGQGVDVGRNSSCTTVRSSSSSGDDAAAALRATGMAQAGHVRNLGGTGEADERTLSTPSSCAGVGAFAAITAAASALPMSQEQPEGAAGGRGDAVTAAAAAVSACTSTGGSGNDGQSAARRNNKPAGKPRGRRGGGGGGASAYSQLTMVAGEAGESPECDAPADAVPAAAAGGLFRFDGFAGASSAATTTKAAAAPRAAIAPSTAAERVARLGTRGDAGNFTASVWQPMGLSGNPAAAVSASAAPPLTATTAKARSKRPISCGGGDVGGGSSSGCGADDIDEYSSDGTPAKTRPHHQQVAVAAVVAGGAKCKGRSGKGRGAGAKPDWAVPTPGKGPRRRAKELGGSSANSGTISRVTESITQLKIASPGSAAAGAEIEVAPAPSHDTANVVAAAAAAGASPGGAAVKRKPTMGRDGNAAGNAAASRAPKKARPAGAAPQRTITSYLK